VFWGDVVGVEADLEAILPYPGQSAGRPRGPRTTLPGLEAEPAPVRAALASRDLAGVVDGVSGGWRRRSEASRVRMLSAIAGMARSSYQRASEQITGDLIRYQRHHAALHARVWEVVMTEAPGAGTRDRPIDVVTHSLGTSMVFDMAVAGLPRLHVRTLLSCASQVAYFHAIGCSPTALDPTGSGQPTTLPPTIQRWANFYVPLDPWAFLAAPLFTLADGSAPEDVEVYGGERGDRILTHAIGHYWGHPRFLDRARILLGLQPADPVADATRSTSSQQVPGASRTPPS
jgi:hypothetical protein